MPVIEDKITELTKRLKEKGLQFSPCPTDAEIDAAQKEYEKKQDLDGLDTSLIIDSKRRLSGGEEQQADDSAAAKKKVAVENETSTGTTPRAKKHHLEEDEEANF